MPKCACAAPSTFVKHGPECRGGGICKHRKPIPVLPGNERLLAAPLRTKGALRSNGSAAIVCTTPLSPSSSRPFTNEIIANPFRASNRHRKSTKRHNRLLIPSPGVEEEPRNCGNEHSTGLISSALSFARVRPHLWRLLGS
ncbi:hypothetical protein CDAR_256821 [Caerostris darwini]|uniref:Uncharacterized protein n=1 Tax=Caerostris darwini TaxID=1538125 RepID=A0AAV4Q0V9_9ARAC|nr:hypothetical protein CDAR_256821 [Caerostris darwini]